MSSEERSQEQKQKAGEIKLVRPFVDALADVADFRQQPQSELKIVLTVIVLGLLCGQNSERRMAVWAQRMPLSLRRRLKLPYLRVPSRGRSNARWLRRTATVWCRRGKGGWKKL